MPLSYTLTPANVSEVRLLKELIAEADDLLGEGLGRRLLGDSAYRNGPLEEKLVKSGIVLITSEASARRPEVKQQIEIALFEPQARLQARRDVAEDASGAGRRGRG